jgi:hypothetical protein
MMILPEKTVGGQLLSPSVGDYHVLRTVSVTKHACVRWNQRSEHAEGGVEAMREELKTLRELEPEHVLSVKEGCPRAAFKEGVTYGVSENDSIFVMREDDGTVITMWKYANENHTNE